MGTESIINTIVCIRSYDQLLKLIILICQTVCFRLVTPKSQFDPLDTTRRSTQGIKLILIFADYFSKPPEKHLSKL